jgi:hypothetical protein
MLPMTLLFGLLLAFNVAAGCEGDSEGQPTESAAVGTGQDGPEPTNTPTDQEKCEAAGGTWHDHTYSFSDAECHPAKPTPEPTDTPEPSWETGPVTEDTVRNALDDADNLGSLRAGDTLDNIEYLSVFDDPVLNGFIIAVQYKGESYWSETGLLNIGGEAAIATFAKLFANPQVQRVQVSILADVIGSLGHERTTDVVTIAINRPTAARINWEGVAELQLVDNKHMFCLADSYIIEMFIYAQLEDTGCLTGASRSEG